MVRLPIDRAFSRCPAALAPPMAYRHGERERPAFTFVSARLRLILEAGYESCRSAMVIEEADMPQAIVDPGELRRFAHNLKQFVTDLQGRLQVLHSQMLALGDTWRDQEHEKFAEEFQQTVQVLKRFTESAEKQVPFLLRKAEKIEEYLRIR